MSGHPDPSTIKSDHVQYFLGRNGRTVAVLVRGTFEDYPKYPPFVDTAEERKTLETHYKLADPQRDRYTKAHVTQEHLPLQIVLLNREKGSYVKPHYHKILEPLKATSKFQLMMCQRGLGRIGVYTREGDHLGTVELRPWGMVVLYEGHSIEFVEENTKLIEIKLGPLADNQDMVSLAGQ